MIHYTNQPLQRRRRFVLGSSNTLSHTEVPLLFIVDWSDKPRPSSCVIYSVFIGLSLRTIQLSADIFDKTYFEYFDTFGSKYKDKQWAFDSNYKEKDTIAISTNMRCLFTRSLCVHGRFSLGVRSLLMRQVKYLFDSSKWMCGRAVFNGINGTRRSTLFFSQNEEYNCIVLAIMPCDVSE